LLTQKKLWYGKETHKNRHLSAKMLVIILFGTDKHLTNEGNLDYLKKQNKQALKIIKTSILENLEHTKTNPLTFEKKS
jgi:hypothetical protein